MSTRIQIRRDEAANWTSANPTLAAGELGYETDTGKWKVGDGTRTWSQITYQFPILTGSAGTTPDGTTLVVDQANDRVGIGTASPASKLDVSGTAAISGATTIGGTLGVTGDTTLVGDLAVNGGDITTTSATANIVNANATIVNLGQAATTVSIGATSGTATIRNATTAITGALVVTGVISGPGTIPIGGIIMWSGSTVPSGWQLCDGSNSTPDLRNKMILGGNAYSSSAWRESITGSTTSSGGSKDAIVVSHTHTITDPGHTHSVNGLAGGSGGSGIFTGSASVSVTGTGIVSATTGISLASSGSSGTNQNLPPYFVLAFIMRMT